MIYGKKIWGPKAWHLLHIFSINNKKKISKKKINNYILFYNSFTYLIPCELCKSHYEVIINDINPLIEYNITRKYLIKWTYDVHNLVNHIIKKKKYSYQNFLNNLPKINHNDIFFTLHVIYLNIDYDTISLYTYDQIYIFFINFCILYPEKERRKRLKNIIKKNNFKNINTPKEFIIWFKENISILKEIICT